ncbi:MAG: BamA/TamA family outer membrane protein [Prevotellaceae bacterium]|jgi:hypothetical protein|nr:BamA/TamA family outer membrane protein [Prevotellaceae bacterium]
MTHKRILVLSVLIFVAFAIHETKAQSSDEKTDTIKIRKELRREKKARYIREGKFWISPIGGPAYTPELGVIIAGGAIPSWRTDKSDTSLQRSSIPITVSVGKGSIVLSGKATTFWLHDNLRVYSDFWFKNMDDNYFGLGYHSGANVPKSDSTTKYKRTWFQIYPQFYLKIRKNFFAGVAFDLNYTKGKNLSEGVRSDEYFMKYNERPFNVGLGAQLMLESRDVPVNAWKGWFVLAQAMAYGQYIGGQNNYQVYSLDARRYMRLFKQGQVLAVQLRGRFTSGNVPYGELSQAGTPFDLRGYLWGQYRDNNMIFGIAEYRHKFYRGAAKNHKMSKSGAVAWVGIGSIAPDAQFENWLPNAGLGYRFELQPRMSLRLDFGVGRGGAKGFYFNFNEAF